MPVPLPGGVSGAVAPDSRPMTLAAFGVGKARVAIISGPVAALQGSIVYGDLFAYGYLIVKNGFLTANAGRGRLRRSARGVEDVNGRQA